jgi:hypothetical protein
LLNLNNFQQTDIKLTQKERLLLDLSSAGDSLSLLCQLNLTSYAPKPVNLFSKQNDLSHGSLHKIPILQNLREVTVFREAFQEFLS